MRLTSRPNTEEVKVVRLHWVNRSFQTESHTHKERTTQSRAPKTWKTDALHVAMSLVTADFPWG